MLSLSLNSLSHRKIFLRHKFNLFMKNDPTRHDTTIDVIFKWYLDDTQSQNYSYHKPIITIVWVKQTNPQIEDCESLKLIKLYFMKNIQCF